jgi:dTDP-4-dehydrorhamnose reductase
MNVLLTGGSGLLGKHMARALAAAHINFSAPDSAQVDLTDTIVVLGFFSARSFDLIINCAAYTDVEGAESHHAQADAANVTIIDNLIKTGVPIINFSTDYVFGNFPPFVEIEEDYPRFPINYYGGTKLRGELSLELDSNNEWWNIRTSWLFGGTNCFVSKMLQKSKTQKEFKLISDQIGRPTYGKDLAEYTVKYFVAPTDKPKSGHYHLQNSGDVTNWADFTDYFFDLHYKSNQDQKPTIERINTDFWPFEADRPKNSVLKNTKLKNNLRNWTEAVKEFVDLKSEI